MVVDVAESQRQHQYDDIVWQQYRRHDKVNFDRDAYECITHHNTKWNNIMYSHDEILSL